MRYKYFSKNFLLREFGWTPIWETSDGNSEYTKWVPTDAKGLNEDIYVFEGYHRNSGSYIRFIWADTLEEAESLLDAGGGIPDFFPRDEAHLRALLEATNPVQST